MDDSYWWDIEPWDYGGDFSWPMTFLAGYYYGFTSSIRLPTIIQHSIAAGTTWEVHVCADRHNHDFDRDGAAVTCEAPAPTSPKGVAHEVIT